MLGGVRGEARSSPSLRSDSPDFKTDCSFLSPIENQVLYHSCNDGRGSMLMYKVPLQPTLYCRTYLQSLDHCTVGQETPSI